MWYSLGMIKQQSKFREIIEDTREWAEELAFEHPNCYTEDLCGLCAIVSKELYARLTAQDFVCEIAYNDRHCFLIYRGKVLDLTATQFGKLRIFISSELDKGDWKIEERFTDIDELSNHQEYNGWYPEQVHLNYE